MTEQLFALLRLGLKQEEPEDKHLPFFTDFSIKEWNKICELAGKQGVAAIALDGLGILVDTFGQSKLSPSIDKGQWQLMLLEWIGISQVIEQGNAHQLQIMEELARTWVER